MEERINTLAEIVNYADNHILGAGEPGGEEGGITIPNPLGVEIQKMSKDYYAVMAALHMFAMLEPKQYSNVSETVNTVLTRAKTLATKAKEKFPEAFL